MMKQKRNYLKVIRKKKTKIHENLDDETKVKLRETD